MPGAWILVANRSRARIFTVDSPRGELQETETLTHPQARLHDDSFKSDEPGSTFDRGGQGRHSMSPSVEPKEQEAIRFAKEIGGVVRHAALEHAFNKLYVVAGPRFLGLLREHIGSLHEVTITEIEKNLDNFDTKAIRGHLPERL